MEDFNREQQKYLQAARECIDKAQVDNIVEVKEVTVEVATLTEENSVLVVTEAEADLPNALASLNVSAKVSRAGSEVQLDAMMKSRSSLNASREFERGQ